MSPVMVSGVHCFALLCIVLLCMGACVGIGEGVTCYGFWVSMGGGEEERCHMLRCLGFDGREVIYIYIYIYIYMAIYKHRLIYTHIWPYIFPIGSVWGSLFLR